MCLKKDIVLDVLADLLRLGPVPLVDAVSGSKVEDAPVLHRSPVAHGPNLRPVADDGEGVERGTLNGVDATVHQYGQRVVLWVERLDLPTASEELKVLKIPAFQCAKLAPYQPVLHGNPDLRAVLRDGLWLFAQRYEPEVLTVLHRQALSS